MLGAGIAFLAGVLVLHRLAELPAASCLWLLPVVLALGLVGGRRRWLLVAFPAGLMWAGLQAQTRLADVLAPALEGRDLWVQGQVLGVPRVRGRRLVFALRIDPGGAPPGVPRRLRLSWYGAHPVLRAGERWRLRVRLKRPHGLRSPGAFDFETWLYARGVRAVGYVRGAPGNHRLAPPQGRRLDRLRAALAERVRQGGYRHPGLLNALSVGVRDGVDADQWAVLRATGTSHLVAISGLHVGLLAWLGHALCALLWRLAGRLRRHVTRPRFAAGGALLCAAGYAALAGFSVPTQRALVMLLVLLGGVLLARPVRPAAGLGLALIGVLLVDPWAVLGAGFWLSFAAVAGIVLLLGARVGPPAGLAGFLRVQYALPLLLAPLVLAFFQRSALLGAAANLLAVPLVGFVSVPLALAGTLLGPGLPGGQALLWLADLSLALLWWLLEWFAAVPGAEWQGAAPTPLATALALLAMVLLFIPPGLGLRWLGVPLLLPLLAPGGARPADGTFDFHLLDTGQGLSAVVETRRRVLVYDTGPRWSPELDAGAAVLVPFLRARGHARVDALVLSHGDSDHSGGLRSLLGALPVARVFTSAPDALPPAQLTNPCERGLAWTWDGVGFAFLHPPGGEAPPGNDSSCVLRISAGGRAVLVPGDIERAAEALLVGSGQLLAADVLVVPHHGSETSSSAAFLDRVKPRWALYPVGHRNRFGFPRPAVVQRIAAAGARALRTAASGTISFRVGPRGLQGPQRWRARTRRYWHARE